MGNLTHIRTLRSIGLAAALGLVAAACHQVLGDRGGPADESTRSCDGPDEGCPCEPGHVVACYSDAPQRDDDGLHCLIGTRSCEGDGTWSACDFGDGTRRFPIIGDPELCGGCDPTCFQTLDAPVDGELTDDNAHNVEYDDTLGGVVIAQGSSGGGLFAYIANAPDSTVSKIRLLTKVEEGRYLVGLPGKRCSCWCDGCNQPSRTAVDARGYGYVASRALGGQGSVTKIGAETTTCIDRNNNGVIDTSTGGDDVRPWGEDECVLWTVPVGQPDCLPCAPDCERTCDGSADPECFVCGSFCDPDPGCERSGVPRALAVDAEDRLWVGNFYEKRFYVLDIEDGAVIRSVDVDLMPYGAAIGPRGKVWFVNECCGPQPLQYVDSRTFTKSKVYPHEGTCQGAYGIVVDQKARVVLGGWPEDCFSRFDPDTGVWERFDNTKANGATRGVTVDADGAMWAATHDNKNANGPHWLTRYFEDGTFDDQYTMSECGRPIGVAADFYGNMWTVCQGTSKIAHMNIAEGQKSSRAFKVGPSPYTYSDFTGFLRGTITAPEGHYKRRHDAALSCEADRVPTWSQLYFQVETPANTRIEFWGRTADELVDLGATREFLIASVPPDISPADVEGGLAATGIPNGQRYMDVRVRLRSFDGGATSPVFYNMRLVHYCVCDCDRGSACDDACACDPDC